MKKILIRSGMLPTEVIGYERMIKENILGSNVGNLLYAYTIYRTLMIDESVEFIPTRYRYNYSAEEIDRINEECSCFVIPLADAIRSTIVRLAVRFQRFLAKTKIIKLAKRLLLKKH